MGIEATVAFLDSTDAVDGSSPAGDVEEALDKANQSVHLRSRVGGSITDQI
jgi:hypothetical protein